MLLITGIVMAANLDVRFEEALAKDTSLPAFLVDPTRSLENSGAVQKAPGLAAPASPFATPPERGRALPRVARRASRSPAFKTPSLAKLGAAPEFTATQRWFNTPGGRPLTLAGLRGHVVLVDFWTYTCINCIRTLPFLKGLYATYHRYGLEIVGVETPEFTFEQEAGNVSQAIAADGLRYPVVQDNRYGTWNAYGNQYWPAEYLIDATGQVRHTQFGEGDYKQDEAAVRELLYEAGARHLPPPMTAQAPAPRRSWAPPRPTSTTSARRASPSRCGPACTTTAGLSGPAPAQPVRSAGHLAGRRAGRHARRRPAPRSRAHSRPSASTSCSPRPATAADASEVLLDGRPIPARDAGGDVHNGAGHRGSGSGCTGSSRCPARASTPSRSTCRRA